MASLLEKVDIAYDDKLSAYRLLLNDKFVNTPNKSALACPNKKHAQLIADEWKNKQHEHNIADLYYTRLANTIIDKLATEHAYNTWQNEALEYYKTDLLRYPSVNNKELAQMEQQLWQKPINWLAKDYQIEFTQLHDISSWHEVSEKELKCLNDFLTSLDIWHFAGFVKLVQLSGSFLLSFAKFHNVIDKQELVDAYFVQEDYQAKMYMKDDVQEEKKQIMIDEIDKILLWI